MTILAPHDASRIRNRSMGVLHLIAADESCEVSDILALLSQPPPASQAPAARMPDQPSSGMQAEAAPQSPPTPSGENREQREQVEGEACAPASGAGESNGGGPERVSHSGAANSAANAPAGGIDAGKSVERLGSAAPHRELTKAQLVRRCLRQHPDWPASKIAEATGVKKTSVHGLAGPHAKIVSEAEYRASLAAKTTEALKASVPLPPRPGRPAPPRPLAETLPMARTLKDRVKAVHVAHPDWTALAVANYLGANAASVSTLLAGVRKEAVAETEPLPQGIEAGIRAEAAARRKRLGAPA